MIKFGLLKVVAKKWWFFAGLLVVLVRIKYPQITPQKNLLHGLQTLPTDDKKPSKQLSLLGLVANHWQQW